MKYLYTYKLFESDDDSDIMARYQLFGADTTISFNFDGKDITDPDGIRDLIRVYRETYSNWGGGPESIKFIEYFNKNYGGKASIKSWYPTICLTIHTINYGDIKIGFGLKDKKYKLMNWGSLTSPNTNGSEGNYNSKVLSEIGGYIREEIQKLTIDESIVNLNLKVNNKINWTWE